MSLRDVFHKLGVAQLLDPATVQQTSPSITDLAFNSASVDTRDKRGVLFIAGIGESGDTLSSSVKVEVKIQESDDDITFTDCADADVLDAVAGTVTGTIAVIDAAAEDDVPVVGGYIGNLRYCRAVATLVGTHAVGTPVGIWAVTTDLATPVR